MLFWKASFASGGWGYPPDPLEMGREVDICGCVRLYSAGPRCQGTNLGQPQSRGSTSSPSPVASAVLGGNAMASCRRWRYSRDRGSTAIRRTTQSYSALSRYRSVVRAYRVGPSSQQLAPARWAMHLLGSWREAAQISGMVHCSLNFEELYSANLLRTLWHAT